MEATPICDIVFANLYLGLFGSRSQIVPKRLGKPKLYNNKKPNISNPSPTELMLLFGSDSIKTTKNTKTDNNNM